jgi:Alpha/beta hydrolase family
MEPVMKAVGLSAGPIEYRDSGGAGPVLVLLHGLLMDASLWDAVIAELASDHRCIAPTLPLGAHRLPMRSDADLSLRGIARLVVEFLERLDLREAVLVGNDTGGALVRLLAAQGVSASDASPSFPARPSTISRRARRARRWSRPADCRRRSSDCSCSRCACARCGGCRSPSAG